MEEIINPQVIATTIALVAAVTLAGLMVAIVIDVYKFAREVRKEVENRGKDVLVPKSNDYLWLSPEELQELEDEDIDYEDLVVDFVDRADMHCLMRRLRDSGLEVTPEELLEWLDGQAKRDDCKASEVADWLVENPGSPKNRLMILDFDRRSRELHRKTKE